MVPHSSTLAWKIPWTEEPGRLQSMGSLRVGHHWATSLSLLTFMHWRRKWQLQCSCLENPRERGAWWVAVYGVSQSRTWLKWLSSSSSRLVIAFLPRSKRLLISWLQSPSAVIFDPKKIKSDTVSTVSPSISHEVVGPDAMIFIFWMLSFKPTFSLSHFHQQVLDFFFTFSHKSVPSVYQRLLIFLPAILIPVCVSSSPAFLMM